MTSSRRTGATDSEVVSTYGTGHDYTTGDIAAWEVDTDITLTSGFHRFSISSVSGTRFNIGEALTFTGSGATADFMGTNLARTKMFVNNVSGVPAAGDAIAAAGSGGSATLDSVDSTNTGITFVLEIYDTEDHLQSNVSIGVAVTSTSFFRIIRPAAGEGHDGTRNNGANFAVVGSDSLDNVLFADENFISFQDLIVTKTTSSVSEQSTGIGWSSAGADNGDVVGCIIYDVLATGAGVCAGIVIKGSSTFVINCIISGSEDDNFSYFGADSGENGNFYNCTSFSSGDKGFNLSGTGIGRCKNCLSDDNTADEDFDNSAASWGSGSVNNSSSDSTADEGGLDAGTARVDQDVKFVNQAGDNFLLDSNDDAGLYHGADLSGDSGFPFDDDILGNTIANWSIGAHSPEFKLPAQRIINHAPVRASFY